MSHIVTNTSNDRQYGSLFFRDGNRSGYYITLILDLFADVTQYHQIFLFLFNFIFIYTHTQKPRSIYYVDFRHYAKLHKDPLQTFENTSPKTHREMYPYIPYSKPYRVSSREKIRTRTVFKEASQTLNQ